MMIPRLWRRLRQVTQALALLLFVYLFVAAYRAPQSSWSALFQRLDPLTTLTATLAGKALVSGFWFALFTLALTLICGRVWCGWICPLGTLLDWIRPRQNPRQSRLRAFQLQKPRERWRVAKYLLFFLLLFAALLGNQSLLFLDPITLLTRTLASAAWPALSHAAYGVESVLYQYEFLWGTLDVVHEWIVYPLFQDVLALFWLVVPVFLIFITIVALNWWVSRFWCRYLCPLGALLGLVSKFALVRREVTDTCESCALCLPTCPTGTIDSHDGFRSDPAECVVCYDCLSECPEQGIAFRRSHSWNPARWHAYDPRRREVTSALGLAVVGVSLAGVEPVRRHPPSLLLRPPGATRTDFTNLCIRCGACIRACPTQGLQPSLFEGGWQNLFTPRLSPRLGYCLYDCQACSQICPTGAIPILTLEEKQHTVVGLARIDRNRCLPWAYNTPCIVCEEMCPISEKAIDLEEAEVTNGHGESVTVQRPSVIKELCIGCGFCEHKCPMGGEAAIRVFTPTEAATSFGI